MKKAIKRKVVIKAYQLGKHSEMEQELIRQGKIILRPDGTYELFSQEAINGSGERAKPGDYFKVDEVNGVLYPYPNPKEWFEENHVHLQGDEYRQIARPYQIWEAGDEMGEEMQYLLVHKKLSLKEDQEEKFFQASLLGAELSAAKDAVLVFYEIFRDEDGDITDITFNFVARSEFEKNYEVVSKETILFFP